MNHIKKPCTHSNSKLCTLLKVVGPGLVVMLADTDAGSIVTAAQSGAMWGYKLLAIQVILIPVLYIIQELTIRLGIATKKGYSALVKEHFGNFWAWITILTLVICCIGALITELSGIASIGNLLGVSPQISMIFMLVFLIFLALTKSYQSVERVALVCGAFELIYIIVAWQAHPSAHEMLQSLSNIPINNKNYLYLAAANIGAVIMPWMIFYQQSAIANKGLKIRHLKAARLETAIGAIITQIIMSAIIIAIAATIGKSSPGTSLNNVEQISQAITPFLGNNIGVLLFALGMIGASLIATIVVSLTAIWSIGEITGLRQTLQNKPSKAPWYYGIYFLVLISGAILVSSHTSLIYLNIAIEVINALLLPIVLGFLFILALKKLPQPLKLKGWYAILVGAVLLLISGFGVISGMIGIVGGS